jgi:hypothetical protein
MTDWIRHYPDEGQPVDDDVIVVAILEDEEKLPPMRADEIDWDCPGDQITEYRIVTEEHE